MSNLEQKERYAGHSSNRALTIFTALAEMLQRSLIADVEHSEPDGSNSI